MEVNVLCRKMIKPSTPTPNHLRTYKLSFFDQFVPPLHVPLVFFYQNPADNGTDHMVAKLQQLEKSLSEILTIFYPEAGRFVKDDLSVDCNDQGVEFLEAKVNAQLMEFLSEGPNIELVNHFVPWDIGPTASATTPMVAVQVTVFECGGLALCVHASHIVNDGFTGTTFISAWATASRLGIDKAIRPSFDLPSLFPSRDVSAVYKISPSKHTGVKVIRRRFVFDAEAISDLKLKLKAQVKPYGAPPNKELREPSHVQAVTSAIWKAIIRASARAKHQGQLRPSVMVLSVNLRGRTRTTPPDNYCFGNFYITTPITFVAEEKEKESNTNTDDLLLQQLARLTRDTVRSSLASCAKLSHGDEVFSMAVNCINEIGKAVADEGVDVYHITSLCGFPFYETDFGWGKPSYVSWAGRPNTEMVAFTDSKCGTGIEAWVCLNEACMLELEQDSDIAPLIKVPKFSDSPRS